jgi:hypothetical protein
MERRDFLKIGGAAGVGATVGGAALGGAGCLPSLLPKRASDADVGAILGRLDAGLAKISRYDMLDEFTRRAGTPTAAAAPAGDRALARDAIRTLYASATFRSMPQEVQLHPAIQARMIGQLDEMDQAVFGMTDMPASRRSAARRCAACSSRIRRCPSGSARRSTATPGRSSCRSAGGSRCARCSSRSAGG